MKHTRKSPRVVKASKDLKFSAWASYSFKQDKNHQWPVEIVIKTTRLKGCWPPKRKAKK